MGYRSDSIAISREMGPLSLVLAQASNFSDESMHWYLDSIIITCTVGCFNQGALNRQIPYPTAGLPSVSWLLSPRTIIRNHDGQCKHFCQAVSKTADFIGECKILVPESARKCLTARRPRTKQQKSILRKSTKMAQGRSFSYFVEFFF